MWRFRVLAISLLLLSVSIASPLIDTRDLPISETPRGPILILGADTRAADGHVFVRRDVRDLQANYTDQWNLFILGLRSFHATDQDVPNSFYQIAGIHGRPFRAWQNAQGVPDRPDTVTGGYCPHNTDLFMTWHRAYLALYEQELCKHIENIATQFPPALKDRYAEAAAAFRVPYWDWGLGPINGSVPDSFIQETISVVDVDGTQQTIANPLHHYDFHPIMPSDGFPDPWDNWNATLRWPSSRLANAVSRNELFVAQYQSRRRRYQDRLNTAFTGSATMNQYSETTEFTHGDIHDDIGNGGSGAQGHMWPFDLSAFEPLFWLHHANVDRLWALWQAVNPGLQLKPSVITESGQNFWLVQGQNVSGDTPLLPFYRTPSTFWTSTTVVNTTSLGYVYPETQTWNYPNVDAYMAAVNATIAQLYSASSRAMLTNAGGGIGGADLQHLLSENSTHNDWNIYAKASTSGLPSTFFLKFYFIGDFSSDQPTEVGSWTVQAPKHAQPGKQNEGGFNVNKPSMTNIISLTAPLLDEIAMGRLESLIEDDVVPYLKDKLTWTLSKQDGTNVQSRYLDELQIEVFSSTVRIPRDPNIRLDYIGPITAHTEVTDGKGGSSARG